MDGRATSPPSAVLFGIAVAVIVVLVEIRVLDWTFGAVGVPHRWFGGLLLASLLGSAIDIPVGTTAPDPDGRRTVVAVNVGGAIVPTLLALWALAATGAWFPGALAVAVVAAVGRAVARPVPGRGIAIPTLVPAPAAALTAMLLAPHAAPAVAYAAGTLGTLLGADLLNLRKLPGLGAPVASVGGAGTFDGIFVVGILAALLA